MAGGHDCRAARRKALVERADAIRRSAAVDAGVGPFLANWLVSDWTFGRVRPGWAHFTVPDDATGRAIQSATAAEIGTRSNRARHSRRPRHAADAIIIDWRRGTEQTSCGIGNAQSIRPDVRRRAQCPGRD